MFLKRTKERNECEDKILQHLRAIRDIYHKYNPSGDYLSMTITDRSHISVNNAHWDEDKQFPIDFYEINGEKGSVYG